MCKASSASPLGFSSRSPEEFQRVPVGFRGVLGGLRGSQVVIRGFKGTKGSSTQKRFKRSQAVLRELQRVSGTLHEASEGTRSSQAWFHGYQVISGHLRGLRRFQGVPQDLRGVSMASEEIPGDTRWSQGCSVGW